MRKHAGSLRYRSSPHADAWRLYRDMMPIGE